MNWFTKLFGGSKGKELPQHPMPDLQKKRNTVRSAGMMDGKHYSHSVEKIKQLKSDGENEQAIKMLLRAVEATEAEAKAAKDDSGAAPWYYEQLAILYRKEKKYQQEVEILEQYERQLSPRYAESHKFVSRLEKARALLAKQNA